MINTNIFFQITRCIDYKNIIKSSILFFSYAYNFRKGQCGDENKMINSTTFTTPILPSTDIVQRKSSWRSILRVGAFHRSTLDSSAEPTKEVAASYVQ